MSRNKCTVADLRQAIETLAPPALASAWDRIGLQIGAETHAVTGVLVALDVSPDVVHFAAKRKLNLIVAHHPLFFHPLERLHFDDAMGQILKEALANEIHIFAAHTNLDATSPHGINDSLCRLFGLQEVEVLDLASRSSSGGSAGLGRVGILREAQPLKTFVASVKNALNVAHVRIVGDPEQKVRKVAICSGAGASFIPEARAHKADCFVTGDIKYHEALTAQWNALALIDPGHFALEAVILPELADYLRRYCQEKNWPIAVEEYKEGRDPFIFL